MDSIAIIDFGGQYTHLIANRIRRLGVYSEIRLPEDLNTDNHEYKGIILSGSPHSVLAPHSPTLKLTLFSRNIPILGLCYGHHLVAKLLGGTLSRGQKREYGIAELTINTANPLFEGMALKQQIWMSHGDAVETLPSGFIALASTSDCQNAVIGDIERKIYGLQFHPEVTDTPNGMTILDNFLNLCECTRNWHSQWFLQEIEHDIQQKCRNKKIFLLVSGGVDSTVTFTLLNRVLGSNKVLGLHIDNGLMRFQESKTIHEYMKQHGYNNLIIHNAADNFLKALQTVSDPEQKRAIIGKQFIVEKEKVQEKLGLNSQDWLLAQGTIYPDTIESAGTKHADKIKTHHNRVDIILELLAKGLVIEPLATLYKDEVRDLGKLLGIPDKLIDRHPFPGPGLGVRVLCSNGIEEVMAPETISQAHEITNSYGYDGHVLPIKSVGVQGDSRTYAHPLLITGPQDWNVIEKISTQITNTIKTINRVIMGLHLTTKPVYTLKTSYVTEKRLNKLRQADHLVNTIIHETGEYQSIWQMPIVLLPLVNENGDECLVLRPIASKEAMTARFYPMRSKTIEKIIVAVSQIKGIGDIFFDVTHKPPGTIEWE